MNEPEHLSENLYPLGLFEGIGIELEYMIVDSASLNVLPISDKVLSHESGIISNEFYPDGETGIPSWSNELALHVLEFKTINPVRDLNDSVKMFQQQILDANNILKTYNARLLPTAMHPWMNPETEFRIWPHGSRIIYETFNKIFGCKGHGWSNLQSMHINLPFRNNSEFLKLHTAIRVLLPVINALTASSPFIEGRFSGYHDTRLEFYRTNSKLIPSITGDIVPEPVTGIKEYRDQILQRIYTDLDNYDPDKIISYEWVNARGCIPRFSRGSIEIRTSDIQECPAADIACAEIIITILKKLTDETIGSLADQLSFKTGDLYKILISVIKDGDSAVIENLKYLNFFGLRAPCRALELWQHLVETCSDKPESDRKALTVIFKNGNVASRLLKAAGKAPSREILHSIYDELSSCLASGEQFIP